MLQERLLHQIIQTYSSQAIAIEEIGKLLSLSKSNIYRKVIGETALKPTEIERLVQYYQISLDNILDKGEGYLATYSSKNGASDIATVFKGHQELIKPFVSTPDFCSHYYANEISWYLIADFEEIPYFKNFQWGRLENGGTNKKFSLQPLTSSERQHIRQAGEVYCAMKTIEIYDKMGFNLYVEQLRFSYNNNNISRTDALLLLNRFDEALNLLELKIKNGEKDLKTGVKNYEVYYSAIPIINVTWIGRSFVRPEVSHISTGFSPSRHIFLRDRVLIDKMITRFHRLKKRCIKISGTGEVTRRKLFNHYRKQVEQLRRKIQE